MPKQAKNKGRPISGVFLLDKPKSVSSNHAMMRVKRLFDAQKAGHTGALDPLATGVLPVCLGEATKFSQYLLDADKTYEVVARLGARTTTSDAEGEIVESHPVAVSEAQIRACLTTFEGPQQQSPSMFSALKYEGRPLYYYARKGIEVPRKVRTITIHQITWLGFNEDSVTLRVRCSKGTYIRTLVDDIGQALGCGAYVAELRRTEVAGINCETLYTLAQLEQQLDVASDRCDGWLLPVDALIQQLPVVTVSAAEAQAYMHGQPIVGDAEQVAHEEYRIKREDGVFLGTGKQKKGKIWPKRRVLLPE
ncbi:tRNA pseudouridine(55) synthase TruB [Idiomarina tyrosinivorans]|uniref:tRNA pseudouridine synthase B n=1 Tax=Idiomarina tyrosinivorans TaxID=1445662 RepID=A0A432ZRH3_9GAMM|nr:tRNA pseudouridine(55) synthase TruB [Idiomarina tyrosinivorans]RUO80438.1 tRNA pseudouridine(55) synthase TruB [Idiomarina tyrosinivorans]